MLQRSIARFGIILAWCSCVAVAQSPGVVGGSGGLGFEGPPLDPSSTTCRYSVSPILAPISADMQVLSDDFCNASAVGAIYVGESDVDWNSLAASASSFIGWKMRHYAVKGSLPCVPVRFYDDLELRARVEAKLTGSFGARYAQVAGSQQFGSTVLHAATLNVGAVNNDAGVPVTITLPIPIPGAGAGGVGSLSFTMSNPAANAVSADEKKLRAAAGLVTEENVAIGASTMQIAAGGNSMFSGGGRARVRYTSVGYESSSRCDVHGVQLTFTPYSESWWSSLTAF